MARKRSPARLVIALSVAAVLAVFLVYTAIAENGTPTVETSQLLSGHYGNVSLGGKVLRPVTGNSYSATGKRFWIRDVNGPTKVQVVYHGSVPDLFKVGRHVIVDGRLRNGVFVAKRDSMVTKCPSKYVPKKD